jgi:hypothetical protein
MLWTRVHEHWLHDSNDATLNLVCSIVVLEYSKFSTKFSMQPIWRVATATEVYYLYTH